MTDEDFNYNMSIAWTVAQTIEKLPLAEMLTRPATTAGERENARVLYALQQAKTELHNP